jgi:hypothetical protein
VADEGSAVASAGIATRPLESRRPLPPPIPQESERPIHVTIGRIEVTAVTSASRDREKVKVRPRVSLDNYLAGRRKGSR